MGKSRIKNKKVPRNTLDDYDILLLSNSTLIEKYWDALCPLLQRSLDKDTDGELTVDDIKHQALQMVRMFVIVIKSDVLDSPSVKGVFVLQLATYSQFCTMNVVALAGSNLKLLMSRYWGAVCGWVYMLGIRRIECLVSPAMERILQGSGFHMRHIRMVKNLEVNYD